jgi:hypothetical protein
MFLTNLEATSPFSAIAAAIATYGVEVLSVRNDDAAVSLDRAMTDRKLANA